MIFHEQDYYYRGTHIIRGETFLLGYFHLLHILSFWLKFLQRETKNVSDDLTYRVYDPQPSQIMIEPLNLEFSSVKRF